jgi:hypothetical protein
LWLRCRPSAIGRLTMSEHHIANEILHCKWGVEIALDPGLHWKIQHPIEVELKLVS